MKFRILLVTLFLSSSCLFAQFDSRKGDLTVGLSGIPVIIFYDSNHDKFYNTGFVIKGTFGIYISDKISLENSLIYHYSPDVKPYYRKKAIISHGLGLQLSLRYHFFLKEKISLFADAGLGLGNIKYSGGAEYQQVEQYDSGVILFSGGVGTLVKLYKGLDFEFFLPYVHAISNTVDENIYHRQTLYHGLAPTIGFRYNF